MKRLQYIFVAAAIITSISVCSFTAIKANAETVNNRAPECTYEVYKIQLGDTLDSIAKEHNNSNFYSNSEYISEVKRINSLYSDDIHAGCYLTVVSYQ